eukprot:TRINITY_DN3339_c0_g1_i1.p1 TRINITY_DN3339_c0_g1~~TRINITY_DN3339_c0_g1_i1.p1  ORF type:complete len:2265 (-),score=379.79 TRINITY_DN3339_c0_g1_i1:70-6864(-)
MTVQFLSLVLALLFSRSATQQGDPGTIFSIQFEISSDPNVATPAEYFDAMQIAFSDAQGASVAEGSGVVGAGGSASFADGSFLAAVSFDQALVSRTMMICDMEPFWEKGQSVYDLRNCRLSPVKLIIWSLVPVVAMSCGLFGLWSRQRNVRGRGKETQIWSLVSLGLSVLSVGYDWFFCWTLYRHPQGDFQQSVHELGIACLLADIALNFLAVHFWFRRRFLVSMPWYEFHKHGVGLHSVFFLMYINPQSALLFQSRLFDIDLFNIHFGTPSKMNEVLSTMGCMSLLADFPMLILKLLVYFLDSTGLQAPKVTRVSMGLTVISMTMVLKRQYVASVERSWYQEIVRMAGVRRLTTYGGASRWLKFQKRPSAAADVRGVSTSQQQLFLAWMQSMGRRQDSIFQDAANANKAILDEDQDVSDDSEDELDEEASDADEESSSEEADDSEAEEQTSSRQASSRKESNKTESSARSDRSGSSPSSGSEDSGSSGSEGSGSEATSKHSKDVELQSYKKKHRRDKGKYRPAREGSPLGGRRGTGSSSGGILGFARGIAEDVGQSSIVSESDIMMFAKHVANKASDSGVVTESFNDDGFRDADVFSNTSAVSGMLRFARGVANAGDLASVTSAGDSDVLAFARRVANNASNSGVGGTSVTDTSDIMALARKAARNASESGVDAESDVMAFARQAARNVSASGVSASGVSASGVSGGASESDVYTFARKIAAQALNSDVTGTSMASGGTSNSGDVIKFARRAAKEVSHSGVGPASSVPSGAESDVFAFAQKVANNVSESGVGAGAGDGSSVMESDIFALARQAAEGGAAFAPPSGTGTSISALSAGSGLDIMRYAQRVAGDVSRGGFSESSAGQSIPESDLLAFARRAAAEADSRSGVSSRSLATGDIFVAARPGDGASSVGDQSDLFALARAAADQVSRSGVPSVSSAGRSLPGGLQDLFANADSRSGAGSEISDLLALARGAADQVSHSGVHSVAGSSLAGGLGGLFTQADSQSGVGSEYSDLIAAARAAADQVSRSGVASSAAASQLQGGMQSLFGTVHAESQSGAGTECSDLFAFAQTAAQDVSRSGVQSSAASRSQKSVNMQDVFGPLFGEKLRAPAAPPNPGEYKPVAPPNPGEAASDSGVSDLFAVARGAAEQASQSGVTSSAAGSRSSGGSLGKLFAGRHSATQADQVSESSAGDDLAEVARQAALEASRSGVQSSASGLGRGVGNVGELFASSVRKTPASAAALQSAPVRLPNPEETQSVASSAGSDLFAAALGAADGVSRSGVQSSVPAGSASAVRDLFGSTRRKGASPSPPAHVPNPEEGHSVVSSAGSDLFAAALGAADGVSRSGVQSSAAGGQSSAAGLRDLFGSSRKNAAPPAPPAQLPNPEDGHSVVSSTGSDLFAAALGAADGVSRSGVQSSAPGGHSSVAGLNDLFAGSRKVVPPKKESVQHDAESEAGSDYYFAAARGAADQASRSGVQSSVPGAQLGAAGLGGLITGVRKGAQQSKSAGSGSAPPRHDARQNMQQQDRGPDFLAAAMDAADEFSQSGVGSSHGSDIFGAARMAADEFSQSGIGDESGSDIFGVARQAAAEASRSGVGTQSGVGSGASGLFVSRAAPKPKAPAGDFEFRPPARRQMMADAKHTQAPPSAIAPDEFGVTHPPWAVLALPGLPPPPPPPRRRPPHPPGTVPPLPAEQVLPSTSPRDREKQQTQFADQGNVQRQAADKLTKQEHRQPGELPPLATDVPAANAENTDAGSFDFDSICFRRSNAPVALGSSSPRPDRQAICSDASRRHIREPFAGKSKKARALNATAESMTASSVTAKSSPEADQPKETRASSIGSKPSLFGIKPDAPTGQANPSSQAAVPRTSALPPTDTQISESTTVPRPPPRPQSDASGQVVKQRPKPPPPSRPPSRKQPRPEVFNISTPRPQDFDISTPRPQDFDVSTSRPEDCSASSAATVADQDHAALAQQSLSGQMPSPRQPLSSSSTLPQQNQSDQVPSPWQSLSSSSALVAQHDSSGQIPLPRDPTSPDSASAQQNQSDQMASPRQSLPHGTESAHRSQSDQMSSPRQPLSCNFVSDQQRSSPRQPPSPSPSLDQQNRFGQTPLPASAQQSQLVEMFSPRQPLSRNSVPDQQMSSPRQPQSPSTALDQQNRSGQTPLPASAQQSQLVQMYSPRQPLSPGAPCAAAPTSTTTPSYSPRQGPAERQQRLEMLRRMREGGRDYKKKHSRDSCPQTAAGAGVSPREAAGAGVSPREDAASHGTGV